MKRNKWKSRTKFKDGRNEGTRYFYIIKNRAGIIENNYKGYTTEEQKKWKIDEKWSNLKNQKNKRT